MHARAGVPSIAELLARGIWDAVVSPMLLRPLLAPGAAAAALTPVAAASAVPLSARAAAAAAGSSLSGSGAGGKLQQRVRPVCCLFVLERLFQQLSYTPLLHQLLLALVCGEPQTPSSGKAAASDAAAPRSCKRTLLELLSGDQPYPAMLTLRLLVVMLNNRQISAELLEALSLLPRRRATTTGGAGSGSSSDDPAADPHLLLQVCLNRLKDGAADSGALGRVSSSSSSSGSGLGGGGGGPVSPLVDVLTRRYLPSRLKARGGVGSADGAQQQAAAGGDLEGLSAAVAGLSLSERLQQVTQAQGSGVDPMGSDLIDALVHLLARPALPTLGLWLVGWLLYQLLPAAPPLPLAQQPSGPLSDAAANASIALAAAAEGGVESEDGGVSATPSISGASLGDGSPAASQTAGLPSVPSYSSMQAASQTPAAVAPDQLSALESALLAAQLAFGDHVTGIWCEALGPMVGLEWPAAREGLQRPVLRASSEALLSGPHACGPTASVKRQSDEGSGGKGDGLSQSARAALSAYVSVQRVVALVQLKEVGVWACVWVVVMVGGGREMMVSFVFFKFRPSFAASLQPPFASPLSPFTQHPPLTPTLTQPNPNQPDPRSCSPPAPSPRPPPSPP